MGAVVCSSQHPGSHNREGLYEKKVGRLVPVLSPPLQCCVIGNPYSTAVLFQLHPAGAVLPLGRLSGDREGFDGGDKYLSVHHRSETLQHVPASGDLSDQDRPRESGGLWIWHLRYLGHPRRGPPPLIHCGNPPCLGGRSKPIQPPDQYRHQRVFCYWNVS